MSFSVQQAFTDCQSFLRDCTKTDTYRDRDVTLPACSQRTPNLVEKSRCSKKQ